VELRFFLGAPAKSEEIPSPGRGFQGSRALGERERESLIEHTPR
jgi:hypothetical protein